MTNESIVAYVNSERARGVSDTLIRTALQKNGWKESDISEVLPRDFTHPTPVAHIMTEPALLLQGTPQQVALRLLWLGLLLFVVSSGLLLVFGGENDLDNKLVFGAFSLTHIVNATAAYFLFVAIWKLGRSVWFRAWIGLLALVVAVFAVTSFAHFSSLATGAPFFNELQRMVLGDDYLPLFIYFVLLPLQAVVFLLLALTLAIFKYLRKRSGDSSLLFRQYFVPVGLFFLIAILALGDLYIVLDDVRLF